MKFGEYELFAIETGRFALDGGAMFGVVPKNLWQRTNPSDDQNRIELAARALLLKSKEHIILIDTGVGHKMNEKLQAIYGVDFSRYTIEKSLSQTGTKPEDVTGVILTHLHFDHTGGTTKLVDGEVQLTFPNARHYVQKEQWEWAMQPAEKDRASYMGENYQLLESSGKLQKVGGATELFSGITVLPMYGHTPAMQVVKVHGGGKTLLFCADLIPTASHVPVPWVMAYNNNPLITIQEKKELLPQAAADGWILFFEHDPFRAAGTISESEKGFRFAEEVNL